MKTKFKSIDTKQVRKIVGKAFDTVPDESIEMLILALRLMARRIFDKLHHKSG